MDSQVDSAFCYPHSTARSGVRGLPSDTAVGFTMERPHSFIHSFIRNPVPSPVLGIGNSQTKMSPCPHGLRASGETDSQREK